MTHDDLIERAKLESYHCTHDTAEMLRPDLLGALILELAAALRKSEADLKAAREDCKSIEARKDLVQIMLDTARKAYRERDNELSRQRETIGKLREALEKIGNYQCYLPDTPGEVARAALSETKP